MRKRFFLGIALLLLFCPRPASRSSWVYAAEATGETARALILCIGDGLGWGALSIAETMVSGTTFLSGAEAIGALRTEAQVSPVTDSAAAASALATGHRTRNRWLSIDPATRKPLRTVLEEALEKGLSVGLVTTSGITHATPAAFAAHVQDRDEHEEIARQMAQLGLTLMAGGDRDYFLPRDVGGLRSDGRDLLGEMRRSGTIVATTLQEARSAPVGRPLAFLFAPDDPPAAGPERPPLRALVELALERLSRDPDGYFLMVEGAQIDWAEHERDARLLLLELADFDRAVLRAREHARQRGRTAVVVVADHDTGAPAPLQKLLTPPNAPLVIRYLSGDHTALLVPLLVNGPAAASWARSRHLSDLGAAMREWLLAAPR